MNKQTSVRMVFVTALAASIFILAGCQTTVRDGKKGSTSETGIIALGRQEGPIRVTVEQGQPIKFSAPDAPDQNYQWLKNGEPIENATNRVYSIPNVSTNDAAIYLCLYDHAEISRENQKFATKWFGQPFQTRPAMLNITYAIANGFGWVGVPGLIGGQTSCCGKYAGYFVFYPSNSWGFKPDPQTTVRKIVDPLGKSHCLTYEGYETGDGYNKCRFGSLIIPNRPQATMPKDSQYRFVVHFKGTPLPTTCSLEIIGFLK
ncbi:MAG: immunoglobulin domain-containing protein [Verrucomicrobiota bacterium]